MGIGSLVVNSGGTCITFDGTNDGITASDTGLPTGTAVRSMLAVFKTSSASVNNDVCGYGTQTVNLAYQMKCNNGTLQLNTHSTTFSFGTGWNDGRVHQAIIAHNGTTSSCYKDMAQSGTAVTPTSMNTTLGGAAGVSIGVWNNFFTGQIQHVAFFDYEIKPAAAFWLASIRAGN